MKKTHKEISVESDDWKYIPINDPSMVFTTYDLGVSTALLCAGFELLSLDKENPRKALFVFKKVNSIEDVANRYFSDRLEVKARSFFDHLKALKNKLYSE
jgi:hypothetical protein